MEFGFHKTANIKEKTASSLSKVVQAKTLKRQKKSK